MTEAAVWMVVIIAILQIKHFICDFPLQTGDMAMHKGTYGHRSGIHHAGLHGIGSIPAAFAAGTALAPAVIIIVGEVILHYHIDWSKSRISGAKGWTPADHWFWIGFGMDQALHQATYLVMAVLLVAYA